MTLEMVAARALGILTSHDALTMYVMVLSGWAVREVAFQWWQARRRDRR